MCSRMNLGLSFLLAIVCCLSTGRWATAQDADADDERSLVTRVYQLADMLAVTPDYVYRGSKLPTTESEGVGLRIPFGGAGGGGFGGGGRGGGGFFQVDDLGVLPGSAASRGSGSELSSRFEKKDLIDVIRSTIKPSSWEVVGGPGSIAFLGTLLVVHQTPDVHKKLRDFLTTLRSEGGTRQSVNVHAYWLLLDSDQLARLQPQTDDGRVRIDRQVLEAFVRADTSLRGQITCFSGQKVYIVSGRRRNVVTGAIPVVGSRVGYQPVSAIPNIGALLQVLPLLLPNQGAAILDLQSTVTEWQGPAESFKFTTHSESTQAKDAHQALEQALGSVQSAGGESPAGETSLSIDRVNLVAQQLATTLRVRVGRPILVGGLTVVPSEDVDQQQLPRDASQDKTSGNADRLVKKLERKSERKQLYLIVEVRMSAEAAAKKR